jgi:hypothetical protein
MSEGLSRESPESRQAAGHCPVSQTHQGNRLGFSNRSTTPQFRYSQFTYLPGAQPLPGYTIKRGIGQGGFGEVYYAWSEGGKEVALKLIRRHQEIELRGLRQCLNLKHPNLVSLYDLRQDGQENYWVIMEYVAGPSLQERIASCPGGLPPTEVLLWMEGICAGVEYLHEHGIVHRDLKPANIFCEEGIVKIGDYGLSKWMGSGQRSGQTENVGTVHYMAPELANGRYGKEIDIYALGVILYEMLTGRPPFEGQTAAEVLMKHLTAQPGLEPVPEAFRPGVARALEKDPAKRFGSARQMWETLRSLGPMPEGSQRLPAGADLGHMVFQAGQHPQDSPRATGVSPGGGMVVGVGETIVTEKVYATGQAVRVVARALATVWNPEGRQLLGQLGVVALGMVFFWDAGPLLLPLAVLGMMGQGLYGLGRRFVGLGRTKQSTALRPGENPMSIQAGVEGRSTTSDSRPPASPYEQAAGALRGKPLLQRLSELAGSMLLGAMVNLIMCFLIVVLYSVRHGGEIFTWERTAWLAAMSLAGCWAVLIASKFWEGSEGEPTVRRLVLLVLGLGLGVLGYGLSEWLWVEWESLEKFPRPPQHPLPGNFYGPDGQPLLMAFLANFAVLMALIRWWRQADPLRFARLNLWSVLVCVLAATLVAWVFRFPQPWLPMWAGLTSLSVQLAAPWTHPRRRYLR